MAGKFNNACVCVAGD
uniref:Uncharacterized protein n=1 Tax=Anguilla anguilla TaxID=7936 RepID=A0A0E9TY71_ANGAN